jgi:hypothetical protein
MAGKSRDLRKLELKTKIFTSNLKQNSTLISEILNTYDDNDNFHLVITDKQAKKFKI